MEQERNMFNAGFKKKLIPKKYIDKISECYWKHSAIKTSDRTLLRPFTRYYLFFTT